ncbi:hypothetical protein AVEN_140835-1 [Araneus ventricosus]|uniref:Uncharacterized protein n=1 Tax=Araneus ventricosus TaxID=182803 RepID=A0A4Y2FRI6_ARAVE|nr:hypothetical protein AVEN_140835-1 [Araneus ventricosus]
MKRKVTRGDYSECAENILILFGEIPPGRACCQKPGAFHKSRWMSTILYSEKLYAFSKRLEYDNGKIQKLYQICSFCSLIFVKVWLNALKAADAPINDLML